MYAIPIDELTPELETLWSQFHNARQAHLGPLLHPAYVRAAGAVRPGIEVGILTNGSEIQGFLPYRRSALGIALPVGGRLTDHAGVVLRLGATWKPLDFVKAAGLRALRLPNTPTTDAALRPFHGESETSTYLDLSGGYAAYEESIHGSGSSLLKQIARLTRKATREVGPMRFEWHSADEVAWSDLLKWKALQRRRTRTPNVLELPWARALLEKLREEQGDGFGSALSLVYFGDTLAAAHFGVHSRDVHQYWIAAYNPALDRYSPGLICLTQLARSAAQRGFSRLDLGVGDERFKQRAATGSEQLATATVTAGPVVRTGFRAADGARHWAGQSRVGSALKGAKRAITRASYHLRSTRVGGAGTKGPP